MQRVELKSCLALFKEMLLFRHLVVLGLGKAGARQIFMSSGRVTNPCNSKNVTFVYLRMLQVFVYIHSGNMLMLLVTWWTLKLSSWATATTRMSRMSMFTHGFYVVAFSFESACGACGVQRSESQCGRKALDQALVDWDLIWVDGNLRLVYIPRWSRVKWISTKENFSSPWSFHRFRNWKLVKMCLWLSWIDVLVFMWKQAPRSCI